MLAIVLFGITLYEHIEDHNVAATVLCSLGVFFFCFGSYLAWDKERALKEKAELTLSNRNPEFVLGCTAAIWEYSPEQDHTRFFIDVVLLNRGEKSVALGWAARFYSGQSFEDMQIKWIIGTYAIRIGTTQTDLTNDDLINAKIKETPLERGCLAEGKLFFVVGGDKRPLVDSRNFSIEIRCRDFTFREYSITYIPTINNNKELSYLHTQSVKKIDLGT